jgi:hypothetical protein
MMSANWTKVATLVSTTAVEADSILPDRALAHMFIALAVTVLETKPATNPTSGSP